MRTFLVLALLLVIAGACAPGQTAQVIQLTPEEAKQAAALYAEKAAVEAKIEALRVTLNDKYARSVCPAGATCSCLFNVGTGYCISDRIYKSGWENGFIYSSDFKFIVPAPLPSTLPQGSGCSTMWLTSPMMHDNVSPLAPNCVLTGTCVGVN
jgi:hypothetical protein